MILRLNNCLFSLIELILDVALFSRYGTDPAATFLHRLTKKHDLSEAELLVDQFSYRTALFLVG